jgi:hypothetical protein
MHVTRGVTRAVVRWLARVETSSTVNFHRKGKFAQEETGMTPHLETEQEKLHAASKRHVKFHSNKNGHVKFHSESKRRVKFHSNKNGHVKFHSESKGRAKFDSEHKGKFD